MQALQTINNRQISTLNGNIEAGIIEDFLTALDAKPKTKETYKKALGYFIAWIEAEKLEQLSRLDILRYKEYMTANYKASTVNTYLAAVKKLFAYLEAEKISPNIAAGVKKAKISSDFKKDALTPYQAKKILSGIDPESLEQKRNLALINLLIRSGLRTIEAERANIEDIRQQAGQALLYIQGKGRDEKDAFIVLTEATLEPINDYLNARQERDPKAPLFASHSNRNNGGRLTTRSISRIVKEAMKDAGINSDRLTAHSLRHSAITFSLLGGATVQEAQALARHKNINTTLIYAHNIDRIGRAPERKIDNYLDSYNS